MNNIPSIDDIKNKPIGTSCSRGWKEILMNTNEQLQEEVRPDKYKQESKPSLGVMPFDMWREARIRDIIKALHEYHLMGIKPPEENTWLKEIAYHVQRSNDRL